MRDHNNLYNEFDKYEKLKKINPVPEEKAMDHGIPQIHGHSGNYFQKEKFPISLDEIDVEINSHLLYLKLNELLSKKHKVGKLETKYLQKIINSLFYTKEKTPIRHLDPGIQQRQDKIREIIKAAAENNEVLIKRYFADLQNLKELDARDPSGNTALISAAEHGHVKIVQLLLDLGADPYRVNYNGLSAEKMAQEKGHTEVVRCIQLTVLLKAVKTFDEDAVKQYIASHTTDDAALHQTDESGDTALIWAARLGDRSMVSLLLDAGAFTSMQNKSKQTAEQVALQEGFCEIADFIAAYLPLKARRASGNLTQRLEGIQLENYADFTQLGYTDPVFMHVMEDPVTIYFVGSQVGTTYDRQTLVDMFEHERTERGLAQIPDWLPDPLSRRRIHKSASVSSTNDVMQNAIIKLVEEIELKHEMLQAAAKRTGFLECKLEYPPISTIRLNRFFEQKSEVPDFFEQMQVELDGFEAK